MPGLLKPAAKCPKCHTPIVAIVRTTHAYGEGVTAEYFHKKGWDGRTRISKRARRKTRCKVFYADPATIAELETAPTPASRYGLTEERKRLAGIAWAIKRHYRL